MAPTNWSELRSSPSVRYIRKNQKWICVQAFELVSDAAYRSQILVSVRYEYPCIRELSRAARGAIIRAGIV